MKTTQPFVLASLCWITAGIGLGAETPAKPAAPEPPPVYAPAPKGPVPLTTTETLQTIAGPTPRYPAHPPAEKPGKAAAAKPVEANIIIPAPPPPARPETMPSTGKPGAIRVIPLAR